MKLTYGNQTIDLFDKGVPKQVLLSLSGGLDSASLFYLILKFFPEVEVIPFTGRDKTAPMDYECTLDIIQLMRELFPNGRIADQDVYPFDIMDPEWRQKATEQWDAEKVTMPDGTVVDRCSGLSGLVKILMLRENHHRILTQYPETYIVTGMTANPPVEEQHKYGFYDVAERRRDTRDNDPWKHRLYQPYINVDKKFVAGVYKDECLMESLYPYTSSCVGFPGETEHYTEPCGQCFWCNEKEWAFKND